MSVRIGLYLTMSLMSSLGNALARGKVRMEAKSTSRLDRVRNILAWIFLGLGIALFLWRVFAPRTPETLTNYQLYTLLRGDIQAYFGGLLFVLIRIFLKKE